MNEMRYRFLLLCLVLLAGTILWAPEMALAHRSGCHNLHTCPSDTSSYVCGDLGYPCTGATRVDDISLSAIYVPLAVEKIFSDVFGRTPTDAESGFWKKRFRDDKGSVYKIKPAMAWHKANGSFGPKPSVASSQDEMIKNINPLFQSVYGRLPTSAESAYWISRVKDKPTEPAMIGAMAYHQMHNVQH